MNIEKMPIQQWLEKWVKGESLHNITLCTPDLSCCYPELKAPKRMREEFFSAVLKNEISKTLPMLSAWWQIAMPYEKYNTGFRSTARPEFYFPRKTTTTCEWFLELYSLTDQTWANINTRNSVSWFLRFKKQLDLF